VCTFSNVATGAATLGSAAVTVVSTQDSVSTPAVNSGVLVGPATSHGRRWWLVGGGGLDVQHDEQTIAIIIPG
jgi:hypothetical protein